MPISQSPLQETLGQTPPAQPAVTSRSLFRAESLRARELAWQGRATLALGFPAVFTSFVSVALALAIAALITFGSYARRVDMEGTVLPNAGVIAISSPSPGWIAALGVREGEAVEKGTLLYTLDVDTATKDGSMQQQVIDAQTAARDTLIQQIDRKTRMSEETQKELRQKIENRKMQIDQLGVHITMQQSFCKIIDKDYEQAVRLFERHQVTRNEFNVRQQTWMQAQTKLRELESSNLRLQGELNDAQYEISTIATKTADEIDALRTKIHDIDEKLANSEARRSIEIHAPEAGVVTAIVGLPGQVVATGAPMLKILPEHPTMHAELLAPSSAIGFIHAGGRVLLRYSAFPYQKFGAHWGTVASISQAALKPDEVESLRGKTVRAGMLPAKETGPFYRVVVNPDSQFVNVYGAERKLPASMQVSAYALLDGRPLYQWILAPLYDMGHVALKR
jgi:membrane fusion protein